MPALLHVAPRVPAWLTQQIPTGLEPASPLRVSAVHGPSVAVRRWAPTSTVAATDATSPSPVNTAIQRPPNEVVGGAVVGSLVGVTLIILLLLCCCYTGRGGSDGSTTSSSSSSSSSSSKPRPRNPQPPPPPTTVPIRPPGPGPPAPPPVEVQPTSGPPPPPPPPPPISFKIHPHSTTQETPPAQLALVNGELAKVRKKPFKVKKPMPPRRPQAHDVISDNGSDSSGHRPPPRRAATIQFVDDEIPEAEAWRKTLV